MRPYKFRFWDNDNKEWLTTTEKEISFKADPNIPTLWYALINENGVPIEKRNLEIMQYTGLFDDSGEEIIENDICYAFKKGSDLNGYYQIVWDAVRGKWAYRCKYFVEKYQVGKAGNVHCKIIGNPYDDPILKNKLLDK